MKPNYEVDAQARIALLPRELNLPEPFKSALAHYFEAENIQNLDWGQVARLKSDLLNIALNVCDGNKTAAGRLLGMGRDTIHEKFRKDLV